MSGENQISSKRLARSPETRVAPQRTAALHLAVLFACLVCLLACESSPSDVSTNAPAANPVAKKARAPQAQPTAAKEPVGTLARKPTTGDDLVDQKIRAKQALLEKHPNIVHPWLDLGEAWIRKARESQDERFFERADDAALRALELKPGQARALRMRALVARAKHDFKTVQTIAAELTEANAQNFSAWGLLGDAALELGDYKTAENAYQRMMDLRPGLAAFSRAAWLRWLHGDAEGSLEMWKEAARAGSIQEPESLAYCFTEAGHVEWNRGKLENAQKFYEAALKAKPDYAGALFGKGRALVAQQKPKEALVSLQASLDARKLEETFVWLILAHRTAGDTKRADELEAQLARTSRFDDPRTMAVWLASRNQHLEKALGMAKKDAEQRGDLYTKNALALVLWRQNKTAEASKLAGEFLSLGTPDPRLLAHAGLIEAANGNKARAHALLTKSLELNPYADPVLMPEVHSALQKLGTPAQQANAQTPSDKE